MFTPETQLQITGPSAAGGNIIGIDTNGDGVVDFEWCEGICDIISANDCADGVAYTDGGVGAEYMVKEASLAGTTLTLNSAPEHYAGAARETIADVSIQAPNAAPGTEQDIGPGYSKLVTNSTCRNMLVTVVLAGITADIAMTSAGGSTTFSYAVMYEAKINGGIINNKLASDVISTKNSATMAASETAELNAALGGFFFEQTLAPGATMLIEIQPQIRTGLSPINLDLPNSRVGYSGFELGITAITTHETLVI